MHPNKEYTGTKSSITHDVQRDCQHATRDGAAIWGKSSSDHAEADLLEAVVESNRQSVDWDIEKP